MLSEESERSARVPETVRPAHPGRARDLRRRDGRGDNGERAGPRDRRGSTAARLCRWLRGGPRHAVRRRRERPQRRSAGRSRARRSTASGSRSSSRRGARRARDERRADPRRARRRRRRRRALFQDVTHAEARHRASVEFVANAAHELRTPLAAIVSGVEVLESGAKEIPAERDRFLAHIAPRGAAARPAHARAAAARPHPERGRGGACRGARARADARARSRTGSGRRPASRCSFAARPDAAAIANRGLLEQALTSVATNAARYTESGRISLSVAQPNGSSRPRPRARHRPGHGARTSWRGRASGSSAAGSGRPGAASASGSRSPASRSTRWAARSRSRPRQGTARPPTSSCPPRGW